MKAYVRGIFGLDDAIISMYISKRHLTEEKEMEIRNLVNRTIDQNGIYQMNNASIGDLAELDDYVTRLFKWGKNHTTMLRFIGFKCMVYGLHRAGQDDWDAHAKRFDNRIIRESTRLANFGNEKSDYYQGKIISMDELIDLFKFEIPEYINKAGVKYVRTVNGYIREDLVDNKDVKRGLYMLSIPSNFIFQCNLCEFAHVYKERNEKGSAHPEVKELAESIADQLEIMIPGFTKDLLLEIKN